MNRIHLFVSGKVQGVYFRQSTTLRAQELGLTGWVSNLPDGRVEIVAEGVSEAIEALMSFCHQGPPDAVVDTVETTWEPYTGEYSHFTTRY